MTWVVVAGDPRLAWATPVGGPVTRVASRA